jgi:hypothetical protein
VVVGRMEKVASGFVDCRQAREAITAKRRIVYRFGPE